MPRKRHKPEEIVAKLRQVDVLVSQGQSVADAVRSKAVQEWISAVGAKTAYIAPGSPWENGYVESFMYGRPLRCKVNRAGRAALGSVRPCLMTAGPDGVRGSTPHQRVALRSRLKLCGLCRSPVRPGRAITSLSPSQTCEARLTASGYPAAAAGERKLSPRIIKAQAIRAILFASAMMTTLGGRRACRARIHASPVAALALAKRIALPAPM